MQQLKPLEIVLEAEFPGANISLADHFAPAWDQRTHRVALFALPILKGGVLPDGTMLKAGVGARFVFEWDLRTQKPAQWSVTIGSSGAATTGGSTPPTTGGGELDLIKTKNEGAASYLWLRAQEGDAGFCVRHIQFAAATHTSAAETASETYLKTDDADVAAAVTPGPMTPGSQVMADLRAAIAAGRDSFALPAGGISFSDGSDFLILRARHMTISASGTTAWFAPPTGGLRFMDCHNVTLRGLTVDYNPLTYIQADIIGQQKQAGSAVGAGWKLQLVDRSLDWGFLNNSLGLLGAGDLWKGIGAAKWVAGRGGKPTPAQVKQVGGEREYETLPGFPMPAGAAVGDSLTYMLRQAHTVAIGNSSRVTMEDITTLTTLGLNFYELDGDGA